MEIAGDNQGIVKSRYLEKILVMRRAEHHSLTNKVNPSRKYLTIIEAIRSLVTPRQEALRNTDNGATNVDAETT